MRAENKSVIIECNFSFLGVEMTVELALLSSINISEFSSNCGHTDPEGNVTGRLGLLKTNSHKNQTKLITFSFPIFINVCLILKRDINDEMLSCLSAITQIAIAGPQYDRYKIGTWLTQTWQS